MGCSFYISPLVGLAVTYATDRSPGRIIFVYGCASTALLCPLIFGFPTEMWLAHAIFLPGGAEPLRETDQPRGLAGICRVATAGFHARSRSGVAAGHDGDANAAGIAERPFRARSDQPDDHIYAGCGREGRPSTRRLLHGSIPAGCTALLRSRNLQSRGRPAVAGSGPGLRRNPRAVVNLVLERRMHLRSGTFCLACYPSTGSISIIQSMRAVAIICGPRWSLPHRCSAPLQPSPP